MKFPSVLMLLVLAACNDKGDDSSGGGGGGDDSNPPGNEDADNDGFDVDEDCNDGDPAVNPDAEEVCDGVDNDCADGIDVGATDATDYFTDGDADGYGAGAATPSCEPVAGLIANDDDCDDANKLIHPGAVEVCDEADTDEDCDSLIDDDDDSLDTSTATRVVYLDGDGDGYGADGTKLTVCDEPGTGYSPLPGDCDDASNLANPGVAEVCGDAVDDDCDGAANTCRYSGAVDPADADVHVRGIPSIYFGYDATIAGDTNGDGVGDLAVATNNYGVYVFAGPLSGTLDASKDATGMIGNATSGDGVGHDVQGIGDQDGDGNADLLIESYYYAGNGAAFIVLGPFTGTDAVDDIAVATITGATSGDYFSWYPSAGDVNGDGIVDPMLGSPGPSGTPGESYIFYGPVTSGALTPDDADASFIGISNDDWTGGCNAAQGDIDGDGIDEVLVSAEQTDYVTDYDDGAAWLFYGPVSGKHSVDEADTVFYGAPYGTHLGWFSSTGGDLDGDGLEDVVLSAPSSSDGNVYVMYGDSVGGVSEFDVAKAGAYIAGDPGSSQTFGNYLDTAGDLDSDGNDELAVGSASAASGAGMAWVFYGPISGTLEATVDADFTLTGDAGQGMGYSTVFVGDVTGDGADDLGVGAAYTSIGGSSAGLELIISGTAK